jgi:sugar phosphate isomerase/epimerase
MKMLTRRKFIGNVSALSVAATVMPYRLFASPLKKDIGIQLYTIREMVHDDLPGTLKLLKKIGYSTVEAAGYSKGKFYGLTPKTYKQLVKDSGLKPVSSHCRISIENARQVCDDHVQSGAEYVVIPSVPEAERQTADDFYTLAEKLNIIGDVCRKSGLALGYHNHAFEFEQIEGKTPYDILLENTDPEMVFFQMDTYWVVYGGKNPADYLKKYPGRFELLHIKDMDDSPQRRSTEIGKGIIDFQEIISLSEKAGTKYLFVEQEEFEKDPAESITESFDYLKSILN